MARKDEKLPPRLGRPVGANKPNVARRRHQLIEATIDSIVLNGLAGTTLATVAAHAGLSQGVAVFYFKTKQQLLLETLRAHYEEYEAAWKKAVADAEEHPLNRIVALVSASLTDEMSTPRQRALWFSFWGEVKAKPQYAKIANEFEKKRISALCELCREAKAYLDPIGWTPETLAENTDAVADGFLLKMHMSPQTHDSKRARKMLGEFLTLIFPQHRDRVFAAIKGNK